MKTKIVTNEHVIKFASFFFGSVVAMFITYVTTYLLNKNLSEYELGKYSYVYNLLNLFFPLISISIYSSYLRFQHIYNSKKLIYSVVSISILSVVVFALLIYLNFGNVNYLLFSFVILLQERLYLLRSQQKILIYNIVNIMQKLILLLMIIKFINNVNAQDVILFTGVSYFIPVLICFLFYKKSFKIDNNIIDFELRGIIKFSAMATLMTLVTWVSSVSDQFLIKHFFNYETVASYAVAFRIITMISLFSGVFLSYYPLMYFKDMDENKPENIRLFRKVFIFGLLLIAFLLSFYSNWVYEIFGAEKYQNTSIYFIVLVFAEVLKVIASVLFTFKTYKLKQTYILSSLIFISTLNFVLNYLFIPRYGAIFAAYSTLISYAIYLILSLPVLLDEHKHIKTNKNKEKK